MQVKRKRTPDGVAPPIMQTASAVSQSSPREEGKYVSRTHHQGQGRAEHNGQQYTGSSRSAHSTPHRMFCTVSLFQLLTAIIDSTHIEQTSTIRPPNPHVNPSQSPTVGHHAYDWEVRGVVRSGAFVAIGGDQIIRTQSSSANAVVDLLASSNQDPSPSPSVLSDFCSQNRDGTAHPRGVTFGEGSFSSVAGVTVIENSNGRFLGIGRTSSVLPHLSTLPPPNSHTASRTPFFVPGSHSAASGHHGPPYECTATHAPNVLMRAQHFISQDGYFKEGSFSAVGGNQILTLEEPGQQHYQAPQIPSSYGSYSSYQSYGPYSPYPY